MKHSTKQKKYQNQIQVYMETDTKRELGKLARRNHRAISEYVRVLILEHIQEVSEEVPEGG